MKNLLFTLLCFCCYGVAFAQNPPCDANFWPTHYENGVTTLTAYDSSSSPVSSYLWSTGETTPTIDVTQDGLYCVTITYSDGCFASFCDTLNNSTCWSYASAWTINPTEIYVSAYSAPYYLNDNATYLWSNGATTSGFTTSVAGTYCVTITRSNGCVSTSCVDAVFPPTSFAVSVNYGDSTSQPLIANVYLIQFDSVAGTLSSTIQAQTNANGFVLFDNIPTGQYLVKAAIPGGVVGFNDYLPTYSYSSLLWSDAQFYTVYPFNGGGAVIYLIPGDNPGGPGFIGGLVSEGANLTGHTSEAEFSGEGDPISGASIILTLQDGTAVAAATTNAAGEYSFPSLAYGTYVVTINIPGIAPVSTTITLSPAQPGFSGINFDVTQNGAVLAAKEVGYEAFAKVSPNPTSDMLQINLKEAEGQLLVTNMHGQIMQTQKVTASQMQVSLGSLPAGTYFLTARTDKGSQSVRVVKQ